MNRKPDGGDGDAGGGAPLHEALDDLEHMIGPGGLPAPGPTLALAGGAEPAASPPGGATGHASLPEETRPGAGAPEGFGGRAGSESWDPALYRATAKRLASELEIIMNARLEAALAQLGEELRRDLQNHIEIVLPEIVSTLADDDTPPGYD